MTNEERADFYSYTIDRLTIARDEVFTVQSRKLAKLTLTNEQLKRLEAIRVSLNYLIDEVDAAAVTLEVEQSQVEAAANAYRE